ncbi:sensor domain-containing protein [Lipingzhangella sp. LS1_29]|uniref:Sensor domain-containing protein n=1 Tax=Lipingzhangella rawalii TaxID=2055835 RepID=A0ABU2H8F9_9ACTN|nr:sensor domain-containing protein [Lipingzhangella rawalii]MDS1271597.1 sensor domain-containing protein [Lipingzhangella rawalii]
MRSILRQLSADSRYVLVGFPTSVLAFVLLVAGGALGLGTALLGVGLPILAATLRVARGFAATERALAPIVLGHTLGTPRHRSAAASDRGFRSVITPLTCPQSWMDVAHGILRFPLAVVTFVLVVVWWAVALAGVTYPAYAWIVHGIPGNHGLVELLGYGDSLGLAVLAHTGIGILFAATLPIVVRGAALVQASLAQGFLAPLPPLAPEGTPNPEPAPQGPGTTLT